MVYIQFLDSNSIISCEVIPDGEHIVTLKFYDAVIVDTSGFEVYIDKEKEYNIGNYSTYTTIYRNDETTSKDNSYQLSNDGSVYVEQDAPQPPEIPEPTLDEIKSSKISEMNQAQQEIIRKGVEVPLTDGITKRFTLKDQDQMSLMGLQTLAAQGVDKIPWHDADNAEHCKYYSAEDMSRIAGAALSFISYQVTYFRDLRIYINSMLDEESVRLVAYGMYIPQEYQSEVLADFYAAQSA